MPKNFKSTKKCFILNDRAFECIKNFKNLFKLFSLHDLFIKFCACLIIFETKLRLRLWNLLIGQAKFKFVSLVL